ncbi:MAG: hypothetical protein RLO18_10565, partial [Gimesia chilikensis]
MPQHPACFILSSLLSLSLTTIAVAEDWVIDTQQQWTAAANYQTHLEFKDGTAIPTDSKATFVSEVERFKQKHKAKSLVVAQSPLWQNWDPVANLGPVNLQDAPVFLPIGPD